MSFRARVPGPEAPHTVGVLVRGAGTKDDPCVCSTWPLRLRWEVRPIHRPGYQRNPFVAFYHGDRRVGAWFVPRGAVEGGALEDVLSWPVTLVLEGRLEDGWAGGTVHAVAEGGDDPTWIDLGPAVRLEEEFRYPGEPIREIADLLLERVFGAPATGVERLLATLGAGAGTESGTTAGGSEPGRQYDKASFSLGNSTPERRRPDEEGRS